MNVVITTATEGTFELEGFASIGEAYAYWAEGNVVVNTTGHWVDTFEVTALSITLVTPTVSKAEWAPLTDAERKAVNTYHATN